MYSSNPICCVCLKTSLEYIDLETPFDVTDEQAENSINESLFTESSKSSSDKKNTRGLTYLDCFKECTGLDLIRDDKRTQNLCSGCGLELKIAYEFIRKAINAAEILEQKERQHADEIKNERSKSESVGDEDEHLEDEMTEYSEYEEILDEVYSMIETESDPDKIDDVNAEEEEATANLTCEYCDQSFPNDLLLSKHTTAVHGVILENFVDYDSLDQCEIDDKSDTIEANVTPSQDVDYESLDINEENLQVEERANDRDVKSDYLDYADFSVSGDSKDDVQLLAELRKDRIIYKCASCAELFTTKRSLQLHHRARHKLPSISITKSCENCKKILTTGDKQNNPARCLNCEAGQEAEESRDNENEPESKQNKNFLCNICSKTFATHGILNAHLKYHQRKQANIKSDACTICGKQFSTKHYLRLHMQVHTNDRTLHKCEECDKLYITKTALDNHMKLHKGETIKCLLCHKEFSRQYELNVHMRFHTRDYPFACEICGKKFAIKGHLRTHMWRHQGLKLQCEDCGKLFTSSKALQEHSFTHSIMPFPCSYCAKAYPSKQKYKVHLRTAHSLELTEEELQKISSHISQKPLLRKKLTLVQADSVMKEVEVKTKDDDSEEVQDFVITLF